MESLEIDLKVGLDDCTFMSYRYDMQSDILTVEIETWDARFMKFFFHNPIQIVDDGNYCINKFCQLISESPLLNEALKKTYISVPLEHEYKVYQFLDHDEPSFEIVCKRFDVEITEGLRNLREVKVQFENKHLIAKILYEDQVVCKLSQEKGFKNLEIEMYCPFEQNSCKFKVADFEEAFQFAKMGLWESRV